LVATRAGGDAVLVFATAGSAAARAGACADLVLATAGFAVGRIGVGVGLATIGFSIARTGAGSVFSDAIASASAFARCSGARIDCRSCNVPLAGFSPCAADWRTKA
jgi:hypothetical protein